MNSVMKLTKLNNDLAVAVVVNLLEFADIA